MMPHPPIPPVQATLETVTKSAAGEVKSTAKFYRDEKFRTRLETGDMASIHDPEQGKGYLLNVPKKIAYPVPQPPAAPMAMPALPPKPDLPVPPKPDLPAPQMQETAHLGDQMIEGIKAQGKRYTLPAAPGKPPLTGEIWTSPELKLPLQSTVSDPATGMTSVTKMKNIVPGAKLDPGMFQVPPDFKMMPPPQPPAMPQPPPVPSPPSIPSLKK